jgi:hypothetical protein
MDVRVCCMLLVVKEELTPGRRRDKGGMITFNHPRDRGLYLPNLFVAPRVLVWSGTGRRNRR